MDPPAVSLAGRAAELSTSLYSLGERCGHDNTSNDISNIAGELTLLSTTLWRLHEAMVINPDAYTTAFNDDLGEISSELTLLFDEIDECCTAMQKSDAPTTTAVGWFFKKGRVHKLQKHLEALKTTLVVMKTVLHHGKEYGVQNSSPDRLAESTPHTMVEDRAILESVFAKNRNAIMDLHDLEKTKGHNHSSSTSSTSANAMPTGSDSTDERYLPGAHGRNLPNATGVEIPPIPDVLPTKQAKTTEPTTDTLSRRFSKRGVRLGVHVSILDLGAHDAAAGLRKKWIAQAHAHPHDEDHGRSQMSTIDEDSTQVKHNDQMPSHSDGDSMADNRGGMTPPRTNSDESKTRTRANSLITSPMGKAMSRVIRRLSLSSIRGHRRRESRANDTSVQHSEESSSGAGQVDGGSADQEDGGGVVAGMKKKLAAHLTQGELRTPDYNKEFENGRW